MQCGPESLLELGAGGGGSHGDVGGVFLEKVAADHFLKDFFEF